MRTRVRYGRREIERISRTATLGGLFLSFVKIGTVGFGGGLANGVPRTPVGPPLFVGALTLRHSQVKYNRAAHGGGIFNNRA